MNIKPRDRLEFVKRAPCMAKSAPRNHGNINATRCSQWPKNDRGFIADAPGAVLVDHGAREITPGKNFSG